MEKDLPLDKFASGEFQSSGAGWGEESCDICQNSQFYQNALSNSSRGNMLNLCDKHEGRTASARMEFKCTFEVQREKVQGKWFWRTLDMLKRMRGAE